MTAEDVGELVDFVSIDVAFISLTKVLEPIWHLMKNEARMVCLIKPQFEGGREKVGKKGVVRDLAVHKEVMEQVITYAKSLGFLIKGLDFRQFADRKEILNICCISKKWKMVLRHFRKMSGMSGRR